MKNLHSKTFNENFDNLAWRRLFLILFFIIATLRILFLIFNQFNLSPDEAYYWDWSRRLDWGYYSKPPAVAWIMWLSTSIFGDTEFGVRLPATLMSLGSLWLVYSTASSMFNGRAAFIIALIMVAAPITAVSALIMTIDAPLLFFWSLSIYTLWNALTKEKDKKTKNKAWWIATGIATGLGMLSKQTMAGFWVGTIILLLLTPKGRSALSTKWPWLSFTISFLCLTPVIWWNYLNNWITFEHTAHHFQQTQTGLFDALGSFLEFAGSQAGLYSPLLFFMILFSGFAAGKTIFKRIKPANDELCKNSWHEKDYRCRKTSRPLPGAIRGSFIKAYLPPRLQREWTAILLLFCTGTLLFIPVIFLSFKQKINANWPAPFYLSMLLLSGGWSAGSFACFKELEPPSKKFLKNSIICGVTLTILLYTVSIAIPLSPISGSAIDPFIRISGWKRLGLKVENIMNNLPANETAPSFIIAKKRQTASILAFYMPSQPFVYRWNGFDGKVTTQYEIWGSPQNVKGSNGLIVLDMDKDISPDMASCFEDIKFLDRVYLPSKPSKRYFKVYLGKNIIQWPEK